MIYEAEQGNIQIVLTGDSTITRPMSQFREPAFLKLVEMLRAADATVTNAEILFHEHEDAPTVAPGGGYIGAHPNILQELKWMGIDMVSAANNHVYDYGEAGVLTNLRHLQASGLVHAGTGLTMSAAREAKYLDTKNGRVALVAATSSGTQQMYAGHQWRDGRGRPGANMIRYTSRYTVDQEVFRALRRFRDELHLESFPQRSGLRFMDHSLGAASMPDTDTEFYMSDLHCVWQFPVPNGYRFVEGDAFAVEYVPDPEDLAENLERIAEARRMADWVIVSLHNHESGATRDDPSDIAVTFAHQAIDAGADVFYGHGPHCDRGIEIYKGKPIFYSLGHFISEGETLERVPLENVRRQGLDRWEAVPADFFDSWGGREWAGEWLGNFGTDMAAWRDVVAVLDFTNHELSGVTLHPIELGFKRPRSFRGRPVLASGENAEEVLALFSRLSEPFGTKIEVQNGLGVIDL